MVVKRAKDINNLSIVKESIVTMGKILGVPVEGVGWILHDEEVTLLGSSGGYFDDAEVRHFVQSKLPGLLKEDATPRILPAELLNFDDARAPGLRQASDSEDGTNECAGGTVDLSLDCREPYTGKELTASGEIPESHVEQLVLLLPCQPFNVKTDPSLYGGMLLALSEQIEPTPTQWEILCSVTDLTATAFFGLQALEESCRRQVRLHAVASVGRDATVLLDPRDLLNRVARLISEQFGFYHVGIFLVDEESEYAVMQATNSEHGRRLLAHHHQLKIGEQGMVGYVTGTGQARIALDVDLDTTHFVNPFLPDTRSEMTLPMRYRGQVIGALDVQSVEEGAFTDDDFTTLQIMADQLANALINARLHEEVWQRLDETRLLREVMVHASALQRQKVLQKALALLGSDLPFDYQAFFTREADRLVAFQGSSWPESPLQIEGTPWEQVWQGTLYRRTSTDTLAWAGQGVHSIAAIPIREGTKTLGIFAIGSANSKSIPPRDLHFLEALAAQLSVMLQNARHYEASIRGAELLRQLIRAGEQMIAMQDVSAILDILCQTLLKNIRGTVEVGMINDEGWLVWMKQEVSPDLESPQFLSPFVPEMSTEVVEHHLEYHNLIIPEDHPGLYERYPHMREMLEHLPSRPVLLQPLQTTERVIGVLLLSLVYPEDDSLQERVAWIQAVAGQAALTLDNAQLLEHLRRQTWELRRAYEEARHLNEVRAQMIQNVSHELRTPLSLILGYTEMLEGEDIGPLALHQKQILRTIHSRAQSLNRMVQSLTSLQGRMRLEAVTPVALNDLLTQVVQEFQEFAAQQGIRFCLEIPADIPPIPGDIERLHLAFSHLLENAVKFSLDGGNVFIRVTMDDKWIVTSVTDQGVGIADEHLDRIFECFYQIDGSTTRRFGGMGIGLALVWEIVEAHGGRIEVESRHGAGSTFTVYLVHDVSLIQSILREPLEDKLHYVSEQDEDVNAEREVTSP